MVLVLVLYACECSNFTLVRDHCIGVMDLAAQIGARAHQVEAMGSYIGIFEFLVWSLMRNAALHMLFGESLVDIGAVFAPAIAPVFVDLPVEQTCVVVACLATSSGLLAAGARAGVLPRVNHYVVGVPLANCTNSLVLDCTSLATQLSSPGPQSCGAMSLNAGFALRLTGMVGDCGVECMCFFEGRNADHLTVRQIRRDLAEFMRRRQLDVRFQDAFVACQEAAPPMPSSLCSLVGPQLSANSSSGGMGPSGLTRKAPVSADELTLPSAGVRQQEPAAQDARAPSDGSADRSVLCPPCQPVLDHKPASAADAAQTDMTFNQYLGSLPGDKLLAICDSYASLKAAEADWLAAFPRVRSASVKLSAARQKQSSTVRHRLAVGAAYWRWRRSSDGACSAAPLRDFNLVRSSPAQCRSRVLKKDRVFLARCAKLAQAAEGGCNVLEARGRGGRTRIGAGRKVPSQYLRRRRGNQGPRYVAGFLREELSDWFVSIRSAVHGRIPPKFVLAHAQGLASKVVREMRKNAEFIRLPILNKQWLLSWQRDYGVCFRKPNKRFKCSWQTLKRRVGAMWTNLYFVRALAVELLGHDLPIYGIDQTPLFMNESGSRKMATLAIEGAPEVALKENHGATRQRVSVINDLRLIRPGRGLAAKTLAHRDLVQGQDPGRPQRCHCGRGSQLQPGLSRERVLPS